MAVGSAVSALNRPGWIRKAQQVFTARFAGAFVDNASRRPFCFLAGADTQIATTEPRGPWAPAVSWKSTRCAHHPWPAPHQHQL